MISSKKKRFCNPHLLNISNFLCTLLNINRKHKIRYFLFFWQLGIRCVFFKNKRSVFVALFNINHTIRFYLFFEKIGLEIRTFWKCLISFVLYYISIENIKLCLFFCFLLWTKGYISFALFNIKHKIRFFSFVFF